MIFVFIVFSCEGADVPFRCVHQPVADENTSSGSCHVSLTNENAIELYSAGVISLVPFDLLCALKTDFSCPQVRVENRLLSLCVDRVYDVALFGR